MLFNVDDHVILHMHIITYDITCFCFFACVLIIQYSS